jgi:hypothetical protein
LKLVVIGEDCSDLTGGVQIASRQVDRVERSHRGRIDQRGLFEQRARQRRQLGAGDDVVDDRQAIRKRRCSAADRRAMISSRSRSSRSMSTRRLGKVQGRP